MLGDGALPDQFVVLRMRADPEPGNPVCDFDTEHSIALTNSDRTESPDLFEMKRRVMRVALESLETPSRLRTHRFGQLVE